MRIKRCKVQSTYFRESGKMPAAGKIYLFVNYFICIMPDSRHKSLN